MNTEALSWLLIFEFVLPFLVLSIILSLVLIKSRKHNKEAVRRLISNIKASEEQDRSEILEFLQRKIKLDDKEANQKAKKILNDRKFLFRNLISGILDKNVDALVSLENDMNRVITHYHTLDVQGGDSTAEHVSVGEDNAIDLEAEIKPFKSEIKSLKKEVHITLTTLNNIFAEFSSMFGEEVPETEMSVDQIIAAMESFAGKDVAAKVKKDPEIAKEIESLISTDIEPEEAVDDDSSDPVSFDEKVEDLLPDLENEVAEVKEPEPEEVLDFSIDNELDDIDSALDELELGASSSDEPSWDEAFEESGDKKTDEK